MRVLDLLVSFRESRKGQMAVVGALCAPVLLAAVVGGTELTAYRGHANVLQDTADGAALAAIREAGLKGWSRKIAENVARNYIKANILNSANKNPYYTIDTAVDERHRTITVTIEQDHYPYFTARVMPSPQIRVTATAAVFGQANVCIIVNSPDDKDAFKLDGSGTVDAVDCAAYSNSTDKTGINAKKDSRLLTTMSCSAGGFSGSGKNYDPMPLTDCPPFRDPLAARAEMLDSMFSSTTCDHKKLKIDDDSVVLYPGVYCGDIHITKGAIALLKPGIYVIADGKLKVDKDAALIGKGVGFVFTGKKAKLELKNESSIALTAPEDGPMAGILIYAQQAGRKGEFKIESNDAKQLVGTVYLPHDSLKIGADENNDGICDVDLELAGGEVAPVASEVNMAVSELCQSNVGALSAWTAIVVDKLKVTNGAKITINTDYSSSTIPVPDGLGPANGESRLIR